MEVGQTPSYHVSMPDDSVSSKSWLAHRAPPQAYFAISALFHYLGPAFAVLLFAAIAPLGTAWLRILTAAAIFAVWRRPWRYAARLSIADRWTIAAMGVVLAGMNSVFYLAIARLPLGTVGAIEFLGPVALAALGARDKRNAWALAAAVAGVFMLTKISWTRDPLGYAFALANCGLFSLYIVLGHRMAGQGGIDRLAGAMIVAAVVALPFGVGEATPAFADWTLLAAAIGVGICSSVIPYVTDQLAMARLPRASFAMMLSILPAMAALTGLIVLEQVPDRWEIAGIALVVLGVAIHRPSPG